jgi:chromosome segregation ATPase
MKKHSE